MQNRFPDFFIIGAAKCGTTSLYHYLKQHPDIFLPLSYIFKEPNFLCKYPEDISGFDALPLNFKRIKTLDKYLKLFENAAENQIIGEASTSYSKYPLIKGVPKNIHLVNPNAKLIYLVRNPYDRIISSINYKIQRKYNNDKTKFHDLMLNTFNYTTSDYYQQIQKYLEYFNKEQILIISFEYFVNNIVSVLKDVIIFLEKDFKKLNINNKIDIIHNKGKLNKVVDDQDKQYIIENIHLDNLTKFKNILDNFNVLGKKQIMGYDV